MMKKLIDFSVNHPVPILMAVLSILLFGGISLVFLSVDFLPRIGVRSLIAATEYPGIAADEIRSMITIPLEDSLASMKGLKSISSVSREGVSLITAELHWGTDVDMAMVECREIIDASFDKLPSKCKKPSVVRNDTAKTDTITLIILPKDDDLVYARYIAEKEIKPKFQRIQGAGVVNLEGGEKEQIEIRVQKERMESRGLSLSQIAQTLGQSNFEYPAGMLREGERELLVQTSGLFKSESDIGAVPLSYNAGGLVRVSDVGTVSRGIQEKETFVVYKGKSCIKLGIQKRQDASPVRLASTVRNEISRLENMYGSYFSFIVVNDESLAVTRSLFSLFISALIGILVTFLVILYFFHSALMSALLSSVIPICAFSSFAILWITGRTLNIMSLSGIALGIGVVVDMGSVVLENIQKQIQENGFISKGGIQEAAGEVVMSNIGSAITTVIVFIPVLLMKGIIEELFSDLAISIITSITVSCLLSFSYIPALTGLFAHRLLLEKAERKLVVFLTDFYHRSVTWLIGRKILVTLLMVLCIAFSVTSFKLLKMEFLPQLSTDRITANLEFESGTSVNYMERTAKEIINRLDEKDFVKDMYISGGIDVREYTVLSDPEKKKERISVHILLNTKKGSYSDALKTIGSILETDRATVQIEEKSDLMAQVLQIRGNRVVVTAENQAAALIAATQFAGDESLVYPRETSWDYSFVPDRIANSRFGLSAMYTASIVSGSLEGLDSSPFYENGLQIPVKVMLLDKDSNSIEKIKDVGVSLENGSMIPLRALGEIERKEQEKIMYRYNRKDAKIARLGNTAAFSASEGVEIVNLQAEQIADMTGNAIFLLVGIVVLLYLVLAAQLENFVIPGVLLLALPPSFTGAFAALLVFGKTLNINGVIALVILFGVAVNSSIILYEACIQNACITATSIIDSSVGKLRAILVTNITTIVALLPFAFDPGNISSQSSLSLAIIGGLTLSTIIVLYVVPTILLAILSKRNAKLESI